MGNCLRRSNNKVSAQDHEKHEEAKTLEAKKTAQMPLPSNLKLKRKSVRFDLQEDEDSGRGNVVSGESTKNGVVRIKLVVTQEELKQLLDYKKDSNHSSLEQLLSAVRNRGTKVSEIGTSNDESTGSGWSPTLESIPEDQD
ncbi:PREDICTED: DUF4228 [Prunus dulcis]|uniref:PREDICTED: DUF4228 n=1 Tax=Prunus dulcis TaxID=3755 RepID=A0A5E4EQB8_PRUDU|nr:uncharacterized protein LOC117621933 [Prunus dulcis]KAI5340327.1 hypothetical protein L3X38_019601 [Prunus dulcis]VVA17616.1 PREDICTED: DUF4228 [Prunus dulcis]